MFFPSSKLQCSFVCFQYFHCLLCTLPAVLLPGNLVKSSFRDALCTAVCVEVKVSQHIYVESFSRCFYPKRFTNEEYKYLPLVFRSALKPWCESCETTFISKTATSFVIIAISYLLGCHNVILYFTLTLYHSILLTV